MIISSYFLFLLYIVFFIKIKGVCSYNNCSNINVI